MKAIIPTGGMGTRMRPMSFYVNKHFIPVANKPLLFYSIEAVAAVGVKDVIITYNPEGLEIAKEYLGDGGRWGLKFTYVLQENPRGGLADIVRVSEEALGEDDFLLHLGDNIFSEGIKEVVDHFLKKNRKIRPMNLLSRGFISLTRMSLSVFPERIKLSPPKGESLKLNLLICGLLSMAIELM